MNDSKLDYLLINNYSLWVIKNGQLKKSKIELGLVINKELKVFNNNSFVIASYAKFENSKWNFYNKNNNIINIDNYRIAFTGNYNIKPINYYLKKYEESDEEKIKKIIGEEYIEDLKWYKGAMSKVSLDFDNDGTDETIYTMDNFIFGPRMKKIMTFMFLEKKGNIVDFVKDYFTNIFHIVEILNINDYPYLVVLKNLGDPISYKYDNWFLYKIENNRIVRCETE